MTFDALLKQNSIQKQIEQLAKKYKNRKIVIYGTGLLSEEIFRSYDLSSLNIVAIVNVKYGATRADYFLGKTCIPLSELKNVDFDTVLIANEDYATYKYQLENYLFRNEIKRKLEIKPLVKLKPLPKSTIDSICEILYVILNPNELAKLAIRGLAWINSFYIIDGRVRESQKRYLRRMYTTKLYGIQVAKFAKSVGENFRCRGFSSVTRNTVIGNNVHFNGMEIMGKGRVVIGDNFHSGKGCLIISDNHNYNNGTALPYDSQIVEKSVEVGNCVWFGANVVVLPGTKIGEGVVVQAGSVVHGEIPDCAIIGGNPAKIIKYRDLEHFQRLKSEGKFH